MAGFSHTIRSIMTCPHGGLIVAVPSSTRVSADSGLMTTASCTHIVSGCPFTLPGPVPSPCIQVVWCTTDTRVMVNGAPTLSQSSTGICISATGAPQGSVVVSSDQNHVRTM